MNGKSLIAMKYNKFSMKIQVSSMYTIGHNVRITFQTHSSLCSYLYILVITFDYFRSIKFKKRVFFMLKVRPTKLDSVVRSGSDLLSYFSVLK